MPSYIASDIDAGVFDLVSGLGAEANTCRLGTFMDNGDMFHTATAAGLEIRLQAGKPGHQSTI